MEKKTYFDIIEKHNYYNNNSVFRNGIMVKT